MTFLVMTMYQWLMFFCVSCGRNNTFTTCTFQVNQISILVWEHFIHAGTVNCSERAARCLSFFCILCLLRALRQLNDDDDYYYQLQPGTASCTFYIQFCAVIINVPYFLSLFYSFFIKLETTLHFLLAPSFSKITSFRFIIAVHASIHVVFKLKSPYFLRLRFLYFVWKNIVTDNCQCVLFCLHLRSSQVLVAQVGAI